MPETVKSLVKVVSGLLHTGNRASPMCITLRARGGLPGRTHTNETKRKHPASLAEWYIMVSSLWSSGTAVEVHADGPVSIPIASKD